MKQFTILFAEDDTHVRAAVIELLKQHGFSVLVATTGDEAIRLLAEHPVDLLFTDVVMPGLNGFELARQGKLLRPELRVLYLTGHAEKTEGRGVRHGKLLMKPLRAAEILAEICQALST
ncbi:MAG TPA: response regulator [Stellaceae bacterium]|nr:response regulator [Stellaceae bacterium]